jgi:hypothetical protein
VVLEEEAVGGIGVDGEARVGDPFSAATRFVAASLHVGICRSSQWVPVADSAARSRLASSGRLRHARTLDYGDLELVPRR